MRKDRDTGYIRAVARLTPGVSEREADAEVRSIGARLSRQYPEDGGRTAMLVDARTQFFGSMERPLFVLGGAVVFVLAIACANIASLLLARGASRRRDLALRRALGATRLRIVRQLLTEALVLAVAGALAGALFAWWATGALMRLAPDDVRALHVALHWGTLIYTAAVAVCAGVAFGLAPALQCSSGDLTSALSEESTRTSGSRRSGRLRDWLVVCRDRRRTAAPRRGGAARAKLRGADARRHGHRHTQPADVRDPLTGHPRGVSGGARCSSTRRCRIASPRCPACRQPVPR